ncbi:MAG: quinone oxidoreductase [Burkholderiaceae bacterium]|nr:quinone oxidoreductase [Burkholderiaceae bacterium]MEB2351192.1 quinone oxidoreductase [Burkholderiaceae bacterium]
MRCIRIHDYGGPEVLRRCELPVPSPGPGEVLVRVRHAGINFMDVHTRQGKYASSRTYPVRLPCTLGMEGAGEVVEAGPGTGPWHAGERVAWCLSWGSYAEFAVVPCERLVSVPQALPLEMAAAALFHGCTAHYLAHDVGRLSPGSSCLVHAASGGIGQLLVQMARRAGARVFATTSSETKRDTVRALGADEVIPYDAGGFADAVRASTSGAGVDVVFDPVGRATLRDSFRAARRRGLVVNFGAVSGSVRDLDPIELGEAGSLYLTRPRLADYLADSAAAQRRADDVFGGLLEGWLKVRLASRHTLDDVEVAHAALEARALIGKPLLDLL